MSLKEGYNIHFFFFYSWIWWFMVFGLQQLFTFLRNELWSTFFWMIFVTAKVFVLLFFLMFFRIQNRIIKTVWCKVQRRTRYIVHYIHKIRDIAKCDAFFIICMCSMMYKKLWSTRKTIRLNWRNIQVRNNLPLIEYKKYPSFPIY